MNGDEAMFDLLENAGASCRTVVMKGENTLLHWFCYNKANDQHTSLLKKLIDADCDINAENNLQRTPLMLAAQLNMVNTCQILLDAHVDIDKVNSKGFRAIDLATVDGECFKLLQQVTPTQSKKSPPNANLNRVLWKKQLIPQRKLSIQISEPINHLKHCPLKTSYKTKKLDNGNKSLCNESTGEQADDSKYKRIWEKIVQTKEKLRRPKDYLS